MNYDELRQLYSCVLESYDFTLHYQYWHHHMSLSFPFFSSPKASRLSAITHSHGRSGYYRDNEVEHVG